MVFLYTLPWFEMVCLLTKGWLYHQTRMGLNAIFQGNSPHKVLQAGIHLALGKILYEMVSLYLFPHLMLGALGTSVALWSLWCFAYAPALIYLTEFVLKARNRLSDRAKSIFNFLEKSHSFLMTMSFVAMIGCQVGLGLLPCAVATGLGGLFSVAKERGWLSGKWSDGVTFFFLLGSTIFNFSSGSYFLGVFSALSLVATLSSSIGFGLAFVAKGAMQQLSRAVKYFRPNARDVDRELDSTIDRVYPEKTSPFQYKGTASDFYHNIKNLSSDRRLKVSKYYVHQQKNKLPPLRENIEDKSLLHAFDSLDWIKEHDRLQTEFEADWSSESLKFDRASPVDCQKALRYGLESYIKVIRTNALPNTVSGTHQRVGRYLDNIVFLVQKNLEQGNTHILIPVLIKLGVEGGQNCPNGKIRVLEEAYRMLASEGDAALPPEDRVAAFLQTDRELFFRERTSGAIKEMLSLGLPEDTHVDNFWMMALAPNLGLPCLSAVTESGHGDSEFGISSLLSAMSDVERDFWWKNTKGYVLSVCQSAWMGKLTFSMSDYQNWFHDFIERGIEDTQEAKEALKEDYAHYPVSDEMLNRDVMTFMLLEMGVLYLDNGNVLTPKPLSSFETQEVEDSEAEDSDVEVLERENLFVPSWQDVREPLEWELESESDSEPESWQRRSAYRL